MYCIGSILGGSGCQSVNPVTAEFLNSEFIEDLHEQTVGE